MNRAKRAVMAAAAFLITTLFATLPASAECQLQRVALLDAKTDRGGAFIIQMGIAGKEAMMALDTGSTVSWLSEKFASNVPGSRGRTTYQYGFYGRDATGAIMKDVMKVKSFRIGGLEIDQPAHFMIAGDESSRVIDGVASDGILGDNFIRNFDLELDPAGGKVGFYVHHECSEKAPVHWSRQWTEIPIQKTDPCRREKDRRLCEETTTWTTDHILIDVTLDGKSVLALVDTGADSSVLDIDTAERTFGRKPSKGETANEVFVGISGESMKAHRIGFKTLSFSGINVQDPQFLITKIYHPSARMIIGMDKLRFLHLYFAFEQDKIYATPR